MIYVRVRHGKRVHHAMVDDDTPDEVVMRRWYLCGGYACCGPKGEESAAMHRQVCGLTRGDLRVVHHINENKLDNRRANLEVCESMSAANCRPHPRRDEAVLAGYAAWLERKPA